MSEENKSILKILLVGDSAVGKTSLMKKYTEKIFPENYKTSISVDFKIKEEKIQQVKYQIKILDTAGQERFRSVAKNYFHDADGFFVVFDMNDKDTFDSLNYWISEIKSVVADPKIIVLGNKIDLDPNVTEEDINEFRIKNIGIDVRQISVKKNYNIKESFKDMINLILGHPKLKDSFKLSKKHHSKKKGKKCC